MRRLLSSSFLFSLFSLFSLCGLTLLLAPTSTSAQEAITVTIPEKTIAKSVKAALPFPLDTRKLPVKGEFILKDISNIHINDGAISCKLKLVGKNMALSTNIGGRKINLNVGNMEVNVDANTILYFNPAEQVLYLKPIIRDARSSGSGSAAEVAPALVALLNNQQFPVTLSPLQPTLIKTGTKNIGIATKITNILPKKGELQLQILPTISSK